MIFPCTYYTTKTRTEECPTVDKLPKTTLEHAMFFGVKLGGVKKGISAYQILLTFLYIYFGILVSRKTLIL